MVTVKFLDDGFKATWHSYVHYKKVKWQSLRSFTGGLIDLGAGLATIHTVACHYSKNFLLLHPKTYVQLHNLLLIIVLLRHC